MKELNVVQMEEIEGGDTVAGGMLCIGSAAATVGSVAATILTGGTFGFWAVLSMASTVACFVNWADGAGR